MKWLKSIKKFIMEKKSYDLGCVLFLLEIENWGDVIDKIEDDDLYKPNPTYGKEEKPHITIFWGLHEDIDHDKILEIIESKKGIEFELEFGIPDFFENPDFDVIKFPVIGNRELNKFNREISKFPNSNEFPDYKPHITIAYLKRGNIEKYKNIDFPKIKPKIVGVEYSKSGGDSKILKI
jgi:2'-5' RNA ligase